MNDKNPLNLTQTEIDAIELMKYDTSFEDVIDKIVDYPDIYTLEYLRRLVTDRMIEIGLTFPKGSEEREMAEIFIIQAK